MLRAPAGIAILVAWLLAPAAAQAASVWVTLAAGLPGETAPSVSTEFYFENPHAPNIAISQLTGGVTAEATTGGGNTFFGGVGTPVLLNLESGSAYVASGSVPAPARTFGAGGGTPSSAAPVAGGTLPTNAALLGISLAESVDGSRLLTAGLTDSAGNPLGSGSVNVADGGWWVIGLGMDTRVTPEPIPDPGPIDPPPVVDPIPEVPSVPSSPATGGPIATPEPGTLALAAIGSGAACFWRRNRGRTLE